MKTRTKELAPQKAALWAVFFVVREMGLEEGGRGKRGKKVSGGHFFSPGESPSKSNNIQKGCVWILNK